MGYTHYWKNERAFKAGEWADFRNAVSAIICHATCPPLADISAPAEYVRFEGEDAHETFVVTRAPTEFACCKTAQKPYDAAVLACLMAAAAINPGFSWSSDGEDAAGDFEAGRALLCAALPHLAMPSTGAAPAPVTDADTDGDIFSKVAGDGYAANSAVITELAALSVSGHIIGERVGVTYLRVIVRDTCVLFTAHGAPSVEVFDRANAINYTAVLTGITTPDVEDSDALPPTERATRALERNRRSNFARTAASTVRGFIRAGGNLAELDLSTLTKGALQKATRELRAPIMFTSEGDVPIPGPRDDDGRASRAVIAAREAIRRLAKIDRAAAATLAAGAGASFAALAANLSE